MTDYTEATNIAQFIADQHKQIKALEERAKELEAERKKLSERLYRIEKLLEELTFNVPKKSCTCFGDIPTMNCPVHGLKLY